MPLTASNPHSSPLEGEGQGEGEYTTYSYDANGQTLSKTGPDGTVSYTWNHDGRLIAANGNDQSVSYTYDAHGIRQSKTENGVTTEYLIDPNRPYAQVLGEYQGGIEQAFYSYGNDLLSQSRGNTTHYFHTDALGSTRALTDGAGQLSDSYAYLAFGELDASVGSTPNAYLFTGEQYDPALGQYYLRDRYMDPSIGRFTRMDVWQGKPRTPVTLNKYLYADSDPVNHVDPSGFMSLGEVGTSLNIQSSLAKLSASAGIRKAFSRFGCELAVNLADQAVTYGIYVLLDASTGGLYVGQAGNIDTRFKQHVAEAVENTNKAWKANAQIIARIPVPGGREALFKVEQLFKDILEQAGHQLLNEREPISRKNQPLRGHYQKFKKVICPKS